MAPSARALVGHTTSDAPTLVRTDDQGMLFLRDLAGALVQQGKLFYVTDRVTLAVARNFLIQTGANPVDMWFNIAAGVATPVTLAEGATTSASGTSIPLQNFNRDSSATINLTVSVGPTITGSGTTIFDGQAGFGSGLTPISGDVMSVFPDRRIPWRLKPNTKYILAETPIASIFVLMNAIFCEVTP